jgi:VanZ family protein
MQQLIRKWLAKMMRLFIRYQQNRKLAFHVALFWTILIVAACLIPGNEVPNVHIPFADKWVHFLIFAGFAFLWLCTVTRPGFRAGIIVFLSAVVLGIAVELLQGSGITYGRSCEFMDAVADTVGGFLGVILYFLLNKITPANPNGSKDILKDKSTF